MRLLAVGTSYRAMNECISWFMTLQPFRLLLCVPLLTEGFCAWYVRKEAGQLRRLLSALEQELQERIRARYEDTEAGLREWLKTLELPQFEEQTRLEAAAHQLRILISERLMKMPGVR